MSFELILPFLRPIEPLLLDDSISEIMGNPDSSWWYERDGIMRREETVCFDAGRLRTGLEVIANQLGKHLDEDNPVLHAQLPDGSRLAAVIPPVVRPSPALVIRKFPSHHYTVDDLIARGTLTQPLADLSGRHRSRLERPCLSAAEHQRERQLYSAFWRTPSPRISASSLSKIPPNCTSRSRTCLPSNARPIRSRPTSLSTIFSSPLSAGDRTGSSWAKCAESRRGRYSIRSIPVMPVRSPQSMPIPPRRPCIASPISSCGTTRNRPSLTPRRRLLRPSISSCMSSGIPGRRVIREVLALRGFDRDAKRFQIESVFANESTSQFHHLKEYRNAST